MRLLLAVLLLFAASSAAPKAMPYDAAGRDASGQRGTPHVVGGKAAWQAYGSRDPSLRSVGGVPPPAPLTPGAPSILIGGTATWYCGAGSVCTRGHSPSELIAAIDPTLGIPKGSSVTVTHGGREVRVRIVDVCLCRGRRIIDLSRLAFSRLADPSRGVIPVEVTYGEGPRMTLPPTDTLEAP